MEIAFVLLVAIVGWSLVFSRAARKNIPLIWWPKSWWPRSRHKPTEEEEEVDDIVLRVGGGIIALVFTLIFLGELISIIRD